MNTTDISTVWGVTRGDWAVSGPQLKAGDDIKTAVLISLFSDRQAGPDDVPPDGTGDPRGWWADGDVLIGSRLWMLERAKHTTDTLATARSYITEALQWLIDDGVVVAFDIAVEWTKASTLGAQITAHKPDGTTQAMQFAWAWNGVT